MKNNKLFTFILVLILFFAPLSSTFAQDEMDKILAAKLLVLCHQAMILYDKPGEFVLPTYPESYILVKNLFAAVNGSESFGYIIESSSKIFVVFRGTVTYSDMIKDFMFWKTPYPYASAAGSVHKGFFSIYNGVGSSQSISLRESLIATLKTLDPRKKLFVTGFSLGGALATLAALDIVENTAYRNPYVCTFASPRVGNKAFVMKYNEKINKNIRVVNKKDFIPFTPSQIIGYHHVKGKVLLNVKAGGMSRNHKLITAYFPGMAANVLDYIKNNLLHLDNGNFCPPLPVKLPKPFWKAEN